jgi:hypothetical protein
MIGIAAGLLLALCWRVRNVREQPLDPDDLTRFRRDYEMWRRNWMYPFE